MKSDSYRGVVENFINNCNISINLDHMPIKHKYLKINALCNALHIKQLKGLFLFSTIKISKYRKRHPSNVTVRSQGSMITNWTIGNIYELLTSVYGIGVCIIANSFLISRIQKRNEKSSPKGIEWRSINNNRYVSCYMPHVRSVLHVIFSSSFDNGNLFD